jgi:hypothetical protein
MKMLKRLFRFSFWSSWRRRDDRKPTAFPPSQVDPDEFARLISSGRVEDLRTLARRLSTQPKAHA